MIKILSSFSLVLLIRTEGKNRGHHNKCAKERLNVVALMDEDRLLAQVSPLLVENYFDHLSDMDGKEDVYRTSSIIPPLLVST